MTEDWLIVKGKNTETRKRIPAKKCTEEDLNFGPDANFYSSWDGYSVVCPDIPKGEGF